MKKRVSSESVARTPGYFISRSSARAPSCAMASGYLPFQEHRVKVFSHERKVRNNQKKTQIDSEFIGIV